MLAGDFNSMSSLDYSAVNEDLYGATVVWPTSEVLLKAGFRDAYREIHPLERRGYDSTWTPRFPEQEKDRIDFVYYRGRHWRCTQASTIKWHPGGFPSDHAAVVASFHRLRPRKSRRGLSVRAATYNVRHGVGSDDELDIKRTADAIRRLNADFIGLQEVDMAVDRSGSQNQMRALASRLHMHAAFAPFMELGGGRYGLGFLSRYPISRTHALGLPEGNEPCVALAVDVMLPDDRLLRVVNVHFDWVNDDGYRWRQAKALQESLIEHDGPLVLLGDFNDCPESRSIKLFQQHFTEADKQDSNPVTWPAENPEIEIDYIFVDQQYDWTVTETAVVEETTASDHRPVVTELVLRPDKE